MSKKNIKICFISLKAYQLFNQKINSTFGGAEVQMSFLAKELAKKEGYKVFFVVGDYGQSKEDNFEGVKVLRFMNFIEHGIFKKFLAFVKYYLFLKKISADIYISTTSNPSVGATSLFCKANNKKHIHRNASREGVDGGFIKKNGILGKVFKYGLKNASKIIVQNKEDQNTLYETHKLNSEVIKNSFFLEKSNEIKDKNYILWVSRCDPLKNPQLFLNLAQKFPKEKFVIICPQSQGHAKFYEEIKSKANKINNVQFIDFVPFDKIQAYYNEAKIFVNTSDYEGFPNTFIQSCIAETPIVSLNVNPDNFLNKYNCGYCAEGDFDKLAQQTEKLLKDKKDWQEKSKNARKYVKENHDIKKNIERFKKVLEEVKYNR
jgi:glycosyltransferase involved in cell wall biosynthesis